MMYLDAIFAILLLFFMLAYGLACLCFPEKICRFHAGRPTGIPWLKGNLFYGTPSRTRGTGVALVVLPIVLLLAGRYS
ncbi:MAG: hypothetical protein IPH30_14365 [Betaproteobacteria bacterium]|nr:hypothetical protein [Betaproteobacteria bacterium]